MSHVLQLTASMNDSIAPRERLAALLADPKSKVTLSTVAKGIRRSTAILSQYVNGKYEHESDIEERVAAWLSRYEARQALPKRPVFAMTSVAEDVQGALSIAHIEGDMAAIIGPSGVGKTEACRDYVRRAKDVTMITAKIGLGNPRGVCQMLCEQLGLDASRTTREMVQAICAELRGGRNMIIIDEADYLTPQAVDLARQIHDDTQDDDGHGCAVAFVGMPECFARMRRSDRYAQVFNRIGTYVPVGRLSDSDAKKILAGESVETVKAAFAESRGEARRLVKGYLRSRRIADGRKLDSESVKSGYQMLVA